MVNGSTIGSTQHLLLGSGLISSRLMIQSKAMKPGKKNAVDLPDTNTDHLPAGTDERASAPAEEAARAIRR
jgi:hypothetical protein